MRSSHPHLLRVSSLPFPALFPSVIDLLLVLMAVFWGANYSIVKNVFREIDPQAFNGLRMSIASLVFLTVILGVRARASGGGERAGRGGCCAAVRRGGGSHQLHRA